MEDHRTLDEFGQGHAGEESDSDQHPGSEQSQSEEDAVARDAGDESAPEAHAEAVGPPTTTARWTPDGEACERCDTVVKRRWRGDNAFVCADCKEW